VSTSDIIYIFVVLVLLLASVYVVVFFMRKMMFKFEGGKGNVVPISVVAVKGILPKRYISVVKVNNNYYVLGISDTNITLLDKPDSENFSEYDMMQNERINMNFADLLKKSLKKK
jgi:flagellar biogenesis protein FliO